MQVLFYGIPILVGFVVGYFLSFWVLVAITTLCAIIAVVLYLHLRQAELAGLIYVIFNILAAVGVASMWITYYLATHQTFIGNFFKDYIVR